MLTSFILFPLQIEIESRYLLTPDKISVHCLTLNLIQLFEVFC